MKKTIHIDRLGNRKDMGFQSNSENDLIETNRQRYSQNRPILHRCDVCGKIAEWGDGWKWYGSYLDLDNGTVAKYCPKCHESQEDARKRITSKITQP